MNTDLTEYTALCKVLNVDTDASLSSAYVLKAAACLQLAVGMTVDELLLTEPRKEQLEAQLKIFDDDTKHGHKVVLPKSLMDRVQTFLAKT